MAAAMRRQPVARVPVMCQLALGHYFLHSGHDPIDVWHDSEVFVDALLLLQQRYGFDGILINLPGRDPDWRQAIERIERHGAEQHIIWRSGQVTVVPPDDNPHVYEAEQEARTPPEFAGLDPAALYYVEPYDNVGLVCHHAGFPPWQYRTIQRARERAPDVSVHGEVFSPFSQLLELLDYTAALMALLDEPARVTECLHALARGTIDLMCGQAEAGVDAICISSAFAGAGFISPRHYREFVLPSERFVIGEFHGRYPEVPVYTHTCGAIGDRLEMMADTGTNGIDTLDPPPLGDVDLADAKRRIGDRLFIKGNIDPVNTLLLGTPEQVRAAAATCIRTAARGGAYILSSACSVAPHTSPENILQLRQAADEASA
ncbi:MAG TPA: uroporphyrinogen decarboxylase family protein [Longimicrobiales bacterium]